MRIKNYKTISEVAEFLRLSKVSVTKIMRKYKWRARLVKRSSYDRLGVWFIYFPDVLKWLDNRPTY